ncbi:MAG: hydrogenase expression/formation protein HypE [Clostridium sp.]|nr:hydrogenase expression/formation protein HypE [Clostridium sp.]
MNHSCPTQQYLTDRVELAHGGGGRMTARLIESVFAPAFSNPILNRAHDGAIAPPMTGRLAFSTDTFVVTPRFFPGGNIGDLAVNGTVNDLLCCGSKPRYLSVGFVIEEGFPVDELKRIVASMADAAREAEVEIVTGDTKVVGRGGCDGVYINTSGVGEVPPELFLDPANLHPGDRILISGTIANHGMAVMSVREGLAFDSEIVSDTASLGDLTAAVLSVARRGLRVLRDPTRGGLASTLNEFAEASGVDITVDEEAVGVRPDVRRACELLGLDPMYVANEGVMVAVVSEAEADAALKAMRRSAHGADAAIIGTVGERRGADSAVWVRMPLGNRRRLEMISGEQLPRIC